MRILDSGLRRIQSLVGFRVEGNARVDWDYSGPF